MVTEIGKTVFEFYSVLFKDKTNRNLAAEVEKGVLLDSSYSNLCIQQWEYKMLPSGSCIQEAQGEK